MNVFALAMAYMKDRALQTAVNASLLALGVATIVLLLLAGAQLESRLLKDAKGVDLVVGAKGSPLQLILSTVYHADVPIGNVPYAEALRIADDRLVAEAIPLAIGDSFRGFRIIGAPDAYAKLYAATPADGRMPIAPMEAVLGATVAEETGLASGARFVSVHGLSGSGAAHQDDPYTVVGRLHRTGTVMDRLILTPVESVWIAHDHHHETPASSGLNAVQTPSTTDLDPKASHADHIHDHEAHDHEAHDHEAHDHEAHDHEAHDHEAHDHEGHDHEGHDHKGHDHKGHDHEDHDHEGHDHEGHDHVHIASDGAENQDITALLIRYASPLAAAVLPDRINRETAMQAASPARETVRLLYLIKPVTDAIRGFGGVVMAAAAVSVFAALYGGLRERRHDIALLRAMGARRSQILAQIVLEGVGTAGLGAVAGLLLAHVGIALLGAFAPEAVALGASPFVVRPEEGVIVAAALILGAVAALIPAWRAYHTDVADALAQA